MDREVAHQIQSHFHAVGRGDIFWIDADERRGSLPGSPHPHVIVQEDVFNHSRISTAMLKAGLSHPRIIEAGG